MNKYHLTLIISYLLFSIIPSHILSSEYSYYLSESIYNLYGARAVGLGGAYTGYYGGTDSLIYNPASSSVITRTGATIGYCRLVDFDMQVFNGASILTFYPYGSLGALFHRSWVDDIELRDNNGNLIDTTDISYNFIHLEYSFLIAEKVSLGGGFNYIFRYFGDEKDEEMIPNIGLLTFPASSPLERGCFLPSFGFSMCISKPYKLRLGMAFDFQFSKFRKMAILGDILITKDFLKPYIGLEVKPHSAVSIRGGLMDKQPIIGFGYSLMQYDISYAFAMRESGQTHLFDVTFYISADRYKKEKMQERYERWTREGRYHMSIGRFDLAIECFLNALDIKPESKEAIALLNTAKVEEYIKNGRDYYSNGDYEKALKSFNDALSIDPDNGRAKGYITTIEEAIKKRAEEERKRKEIQELVDKGRKHLEIGNYYQALRYYKEAQRLDPSKHEISQMISYINGLIAEMEKPPEITAEIKEHYTRGIENYNAGNMLGAIRELEIVMGKYGDYKDTSEVLIQSYYYYGIERYGTGDLEGAISYWKMILKIDPDNPSALGLIDRAEKELKGLNE
ncbi:MAG: hypothetical protein B6D57_01505 [Candidatus Coatesbacteria bacterium 4484_99]|uniref:Tetratricopeptide repeat protein n=1 Tax=Candidatus Coatesbacteria bacterium 4484_99 TaxID=1970774 RepID=A0A1W9S3R0_9BACT|nr:MAG: hypothetical protein B6D57_01505 [Candidatus Coatesbacteria bacterium 4484_99]